MSKSKKFTKAYAISCLRVAGWIINNEQEIKLVYSCKTHAVLRQDGNGEWIVSENNIQFNEL